MSIKWEEYGIDPKELWSNPYDKKEEVEKTKEDVKLIAPTWS